MFEYDDKTIERILKIEDFDLDKIDLTPPNQNIQETIKRK